MTGTLRGYLISIAYCLFFSSLQFKIPNLPRTIRTILPVQFMYINAKIEMEMM